MLPDRHGFQHLGQFFHLPIDLGRADPNAARVQRGIGTAMDDHAAMQSDLAVVALTPDIRETPEVGGLITSVIRVIPEAERHAGKGPGADQFALFARRRPLAPSADFDGHPQPPALDLAAAHGAIRIAEHKTTDDIGAARDGGKLHILLDVAIDIVKGPGRERAAR